MPVFCMSQGTGRAILNQTFGEGLVNPGEQLRAGLTDFKYSKDTCPAIGTYTITNSLYRCPQTRMGRSIDNTPSGNNGYMMIISPPGDSDMMMYTDTIKEALCPNTVYQFSAYILNVSIPQNCSNSTPPLPLFRLSVETLSGTELQSAATGAIHYAYNMDRTPQFAFYAVSFTMPAGVGELVVKIKSLAYGHLPCQFFVAFDDIQFAALGPKAGIVFDGADGTAIVKQICFSDNKKITIDGDVGLYYPDTKYQWQQSTDLGKTWIDIPGASLPTYSQVFSQPDTFLFRISAGDAGNISNVNCRVVSNTLKVEVNGDRSNLKATSNSPVCVGVDVVFNAETIAAIKYEWTGPNGFHDNVYYPSVNHTQLKDSGMYYVTVTIVGGCKFSDSTYVKVFGVGAVSAGKDTAICLGGMAQLHGTKAAKIEWSPANSLSDASSSDPVAKPKTTTDYILKVSDNSSCISRDTVRVEVLNSVIVKAAFSSPEFLCRPSDTAWFNSSAEGELTKWHWDFGNGQMSDVREPPVVNYFIQNDLNVFTVSLAVSDSAGCSDTAWHKIKVADNCYIAVPSAFTPDGDGLNDYLYPLNAYKATDLVFRVFNRNGQLVFQTKDWTHKWDGKINGIPQQTGVYVWTLDYTDASHKRISQKGTVTLVR